MPQNEYIERWTKQYVASRALAFALKPQPISNPTQARQALRPRRTQAQAHCA